MIRAIIFDLDGVLVDSEGVNLAAAESAFWSVNVPLSPQDLRMIASRHENDFLPLLARKYGIANLLELFEAYNEYYDEHWIDSPLVPHAREVLRTLRENGVALALATSQSRQAAKGLLERHGLHFFSIVVTQQDLVHRKPHPEIYERAVYRLGVPKHDAIVVDDSCYGVEAAANAGIRVYALPTEHTRDQDFSKAERVLSSLPELLELIQKA